MNVPGCTFVKSETIKVLHVTASMAIEWAGPAVTVAGLTDALHRCGVRSEIVTATGPTLGTDPLPTPHAAVHSFETECLARIWPAYSRKLTRFLDKAVAGFDLVHVHEIWHYPGYAASRVARRRGVPYVVCMHGELGARHLQHKWFKKWVYRRVILDRVLQSANALHAVTRAEKFHVAGLGYDAPVFTFPNGIDLDQTDDAASPDTSDFLARYPRLTGKRVILFLGRLQSLKGLDVLARSFVRVASGFQDVVLLIVGPDEDGTRNRVEQILRTAGVLDRAVFTGMLTGGDRLAAFACADVFVLTSYAEGFSHAVLEALAAGLPVVISEQCNFPEVAEANAGFVVPTEEAPVAEAIGAVLSDGTRHAARNGRRLVTERYTWPAIAESMADFYRTLIRQHEPQRT